MLNRLRMELRRIAFQSLYLLLALFSVASYAELQNLAPHLLNSLPGVLNGDRIENFDSPFKRSVVLLENVTAAGKHYLCSGTVINGCVLTSRHCFEDADAVQIYDGDDSSSESKMIAHVYSASFPSENEEFDDIAIFKPATKLTQALWQSESILSNEAYTGLSSVSTLHTIGWGIANTIETKLPDGTLVREDIGAGTKRFGKLTFEGHIHEGRMLAFNRANSPQALASGDSGGPIFVERNGKILLHAVSQGTTLSLISGPRPREQFKAVDNIKSYGVSVAHHAPWIKKTLRDLKCGEEEPDHFEKDVREVLGKNGSEAVIKWSGPNFKEGSSDVERLRSLITLQLRHEGKLQPFKTIRFSPQNKGGDIQINWSPCFDLDSKKDAVERERRPEPDDLKAREEKINKFIVPREVVEVSK